jgi:hypothetical protein
MVKFRVSNNTKYPSPLISQFIVVKAKKIKHCKFISNMEVTEKQAKKVQSG